jgi:hypothetical protein
VARVGPPARRSHASAENRACLPPEIPSVLSAYMLSGLTLLPAPYGDDA